MSFVLLIASTQTAHQSMKQSSNNDLCYADVSGLNLDVDTSYSEVIVVFHSIYRKIL